MRKAILLLSGLLILSGVSWAQEKKEESIAEAARRVRAERARKDLSKVPLFTNDNIPRAGAAISIVGGAVAPAAAPGAEGAAAAGAEAQAAAGEGKQAQECDEACWRAKFAEKREKIRTAQQELDVLQREYNLARTQYYQDPNRAMREQYSSTTAGGRELQQLQQRINDKQAEIQRLQQELSGLEDELRRSGGQPGWAREQ